MSQELLINYLSLKSLLFKRSSQKNYRTFLSFSMRKLHFSCNKQGYQHINYLFLDSIYFYLSNHSDRLVQLIDYTSATRQLHKCIT